MCVIRQNRLKKVPCVYVFVSRVAVLHSLPEMSARVMNLGLSVCLLLFVSARARYSSNMILIWLND